MELLADSENGRHSWSPHAFDLASSAAGALSRSTGMVEDKPLKYPPLFKSADGVVINRVELSPKRWARFTPRPRPNLPGVAPAGAELPKSRPAVRVGP